MTCRLTLPFLLQWPLFLRHTYLFVTFTWLPPYSFLISITLKGPVLIFCILSILPHTINHLKFLFSSQCCHFTDIFKSKTYCIRVCSLGTEAKTMTLRLFLLTKPLNNGWMFCNISTSSFHLFVVSYRLLIFILISLPLSSCLRFLFLLPFHSTNMLYI